MVGQSKAQSKQEVVVGIDSALRNIGVCFWYPARDHVVELIRFPKLQGTHRLVAIVKRVRELVEEHRPDLAAIEGYSYNSVGKWFDLGEVGGAIKVDLMLHGVETIVVQPASLKKFVTNNGQASKNRMVREVNEHYLQNEKPVKNDNIADAVGLAHFAYVAKTGNSQRRCELEAVKTTTHPKKKKKRIFKKLGVDI